MADHQNAEKDEQSTKTLGLREMAEEQYHKIKENAETYPYVWASYIVVYGGFGLWMAYRWRKLRKTEDRVRALQTRLRKLVDSQDSATSATLEKVSPDIDKHSSK
ncbi:uncharacterized protein [Euphorbia lathyris]|uniref:uncharacterized protein n=1 Tax=Euphorbia lathyris TaxID=212925 RepID=UPI0033143187